MDLSEALARAKAKWNAENYTQVKVSVKPAAAAAFKAACAKAGCSMAKALSQFMADFNSSPNAANPLPHCIDVSTRGKRRALVASVALILESVRDAEDNYMANIPINLRGSARFDAAEHCVSSLNDVLDLLADIF